MEQFSCDVTTRRDVCKASQSQATHAVLKRGYFHLISNQNIRALKQKLLNFSVDIFLHLIGLNQPY